MVAGRFPGFERKPSRRSPVCLPRHRPIFSKSNAPLLGSQSNPEETTEGRGLPLALQPKNNFLCDAHFQPVPPARPISSYLNLHTASIYYGRDALSHEQQTNEQTNKRKDVL
mmetsp:Transcript_5018/g.11304  ORF Transcript_5018/g.11304 Transcript_5018/m.11304 type:complete len:112 (+) Transcript_5018:2062-2397(+)